MNTFRKTDSPISRATITKSWQKCLYLLRQQVQDLRARCVGSVRDCHLKPRNCMVIVDNPCCFTGFTTHHFSPSSNGFVLGTQEAWFLSSVCLSGNVSYSVMDG